jgi:hypothetical protein
LTIASRATPIGRAGRAPKEIFSKEVKKAKEDLYSAITAIGREFISVKVEQTRRFLVLKQLNKAETIAGYDFQVASS